MYDVKVSIGLRRFGSHQREEQSCSTTGVMIQKSVVTHCVST